MSDIVKFHDVEFEIIEIDGEMCARLTAVAKGIGYRDYRRLHKLISRNDSEFINKIKVVISTTEGNQPVTYLTYNGVIRAAMLSNAPPVGGDYSCSLELARIQLK